MPTFKNQIKTKGYGKLKVWCEEISSFLLLSSLFLLPGVFTSNPIIAV